MANATVTKAWRDATRVYLAATVAETSGTVEYIGSMLGVDFDALPNAAAQKAAMVAAVKANRDATINAQSAIGGITGTVTV